MHASKLLAVVGFGLAATVSAAPSFFKDVIGRGCRALECSITAQTMPNVQNDRLDQIFTKTYNAAHDSRLAGGDRKATDIAKAKSSGMMVWLGGTAWEVGDEIWDILKPFISKSDEPRTWLMNGFVWQGPTTWLPDGIPRITNSVCFRGKIRIDRALEELPSGTPYLLGDVSAATDSPAIGWIDNCNTIERVHCTKLKIPFT